MSIVENIAFELDRDELLGLFGIDVEDEEDIQVFDYLLEETRQVGNPKILYKECRVEQVDDGIVIIDGVKFVSSALSRNMESVGVCYPYVTTCGHEIDNIKLDDESPVTEYWRDEVKNKLLMAARKHFNTVIIENYGIEKLVSMAPGSADVDVWLVDEQRKLFDLFEDFGREIGVVLNESCLMTPNKSLSGIAFEAEEEFLSCQLCQRDDCPDRKIGFDESLYQIMHK